MTTNSIWSETLHADFGQYFTVENVIFSQQTAHQQLIIFENKTFGRVIALDGAVQTTEKDEFIYHEMLAHVPLFSHPQPKKVLIIGGGDGGILREVCRHQTITQITMVEIDHSVIDLCRQYFPAHHAGAFDDPRLKLVIGDGVEFVSNSCEKFDVIISDCTDPHGPGEALFSSPFYQGCANCLNEGGIFVAQNGVGFIQQQQLIDSQRKLSQYFTHVTFYQASVPSYQGGNMMFAWASQLAPVSEQVAVTQLKQRVQLANLYCRYYSPEIQQASFILPPYLQQLLSSTALD